MTTLEIMQLLTTATEQWKNMCVESSNRRMSSGLDTQAEIIAKLQQLLLSNLDDDEPAK